MYGTAQGIEPVFDNNFKWIIIYESIRSLKLQLLKLKRNIYSVQFHYHRAGNGGWI